MNRKIFAELLDALMQSAPDAKCDAVEALWRDWQDGTAFDRIGAAPHPVEDAGRPERPELVEPSALRSRRMGSHEGHVAMIHDQMDLSCRLNGRSSIHQPDRRFCCPS